MVGAYKTLDDPIRNPRPFRVVQVGAGLTGIHIAARMRQYGYGINFQIYERNGGCGGTWYNNVYPGNTYPGVACDVPSHGYVLSWAPWSGWKKYHAPGEDCLEYAKFVAKKAHLDDYARYNTLVVSAIWSESDGMWDITLQDLNSGKKFNDRANVFLNCTGVLSQPRYPNIPGLDKFEGPLMHSARWDEDVNLEGKRIALVGAGSSSIQILPEIVNKAKHIDQYIKSSTWVTPPGGQEIRMPFWNLTLEETFLGDDPEKVNPSYTEEHKQMFYDDPKAHLKHRKDILTQLNLRFAEDLTTKGSPLQVKSKEMFTELTKAKFDKKPELLKHFIPTWGIGCRRLTPGIGYLKAVQADNVDVVSTAVTEVTKTGLMGKDGKHREYDIVIFATGFDTTWIPPFQIVGRDGNTLNSKSFELNPKAYFTCHYANMPNYFMTGGPCFTSFNGDALGSLERSADHIVKFIIKLQRERYKSVCIKTEVLDDFIAYVDNYIKRTVHTEGCSSWYKNGTVDGVDGQGTIRAIWPGTSLHFYEAIADPRWEDFDWERYADEKSGPSRFHYLGNGRTLRELNGGDLAYYIKPIPADDTEVPVFDVKDPYPGLPPI